MSVKPAIIGVDWGTSTFRAYLLAASGELLDQVIRPAGILTVTDGDYAVVLQTACAAWIKEWPDLPVLMCGMIGSRQGWCEVPYVVGEVGVTELAAGTMAVVAGQQGMQIIPGLQARSFAGGPDVIRGEETILVGALACGAPQTAIYCLPGTHSKWIEVKNARIGSFSTFLTGELFAMLTEKSILSALIAERSGHLDFSPSQAFVEGLAMASESVDLLHQLFSIRAQCLVGEGVQGDVAEVLSGLLIGSELISMSKYLKNHSGRIVLLGSGAISERYRFALEQMGHQPMVYAAESACINGLYSIAQELGLIVSSPTGASSRGTLA